MHGRASCSGFRVGRWQEGFRDDAPGGMRLSPGMQPCNGEIHVSLYDGPIIDAHHHLWDLSLARHPWLAAGADGKGRARRSWRHPARLPARGLSPRRRAPAMSSRRVHVEAGWAVRRLPRRDALARDPRQSPAASPARSWRMCRSRAPDAACPDRGAGGRSRGSSASATS